MTQAYINTFKPRPHFEDVVFGNRDRSRLNYPQRAYIMRDSLYYGVEDKEKLQREERAKMMESNLKLIGQEVNMTLPQMREIMKDMLGSELPGKLKVAFDKQREAKVKEEAIKAQDIMMKELMERADAFRKNRIKENVMEGLKGQVGEKDAAARKIQSLFKQIKKIESPTNDPQPSSSSSSSQRLIERAPRGRPPKNAPKTPVFTGGPAETAKLRNAAEKGGKK